VQGVWEQARSDAAWLIVTYPRAPLQALLRSVRLWLALVIGGTALGALLVTAWFATRLTRPLGELAEKTQALDLDHLHVGFASQRRDEVGMLARLLDRMTTRLRHSAERLREVERRATLGEMARQVNHDIKNGLIPLRNVFRHLRQVAQEQPGQLGGVFRDRAGVVESSITYLEDLAANYAKISKRGASDRCDLGEIARQVGTGLAGRPGIAIELRRPSDLAPVQADPTALRRIVENLVRNACDCLAGPGGHVWVSVDNRSTDAQAGVELIVADDGPGISVENQAKIFTDFYTTKAEGIGLGLSIVRRLVGDFGGTIHVESEPDRGTRFVVWFPAAGDPGEQA
jgi:signal transduction histidine kinase